MSGSIPLNLWAFERRQFAETDSYNELKSYNDEEL